MTERPSDQGRPDDWARGYADDHYSGEAYPGGPYYGAGPADQGVPRPGTPGAGMPTAPVNQVNPGSRSRARQEADTETWQAADPDPDASWQAADAGGWQAADPGRPGAGSRGWQGTGAASTPGTESRGWQSAGAKSWQSAKNWRPADSKGFLSALFDFSFTSFVTTRIIKVLYVLILILTSLTALVYTILAFKLSAALGLITLVIGDPLFIIIVMAFWRLVLEAFVVVFRIAEDTRVIRERGEIRGQDTAAPQ